MPHTKLSRRTCLKGMGGITLALPTLDAMLDGNGTVLADGSPLPKRYVVCFGGHSLGSSLGAGRYANPPYPKELFTPDRTGFDYDLKMALEPLGQTYNPGVKEPIKSQVSVVSGLLIPNLTQAETDAGMTPPPGGKPANHHGYMMSPLTTGVRSYAIPENYVHPNGVTSDQVVADAIAPGTTAHPYLNFRVQASSYGGAAAISVSARRDSNGGFPFMEAQSRPQVGWQTLFKDLVPPPQDDHLARQQFEKLKAQRKSVLDVVLDQGRVDALRARISAADRPRLDEHFQKVRDLERQLAALSPTQTLSCRKLGDPGPDPAIGTTIRDHELTLGNTGYSGEDVRAQHFVDFTHMALACDVTRVMTLMLTGPQSDMNMWQILGSKYLRGPLGVHGCTHGLDGDSEQVELGACIAWHVKHFATLLGKLRDTPEGAGSVLDNTVLLYLCEAGFGYSEENNPDGMGNYYRRDDPHSTHNMAVLVAGGRNLGLNPGQHIRAFEKHPAQVLVSAMNAVGVKTDRLGEVAGSIPELFR